MFPVGVYNVEDYPLNWIDGTYYSTYKGNTFQVSLIENVKSEADYAAVTAISLINQSLNTDFTNTLLNKFSNLIDLRCNNNLISVLDVSQLVDLRVLICNNNQISILDTSQLSDLRTLFCQFNQLATLDVSQSSSLTNFWCFNNQLTTLDVSNSGSLLILYCQSNQLTALDISQSISLTDLRCFDNQITALDVSQCVNLDDLRCQDNELDAAQNSQILIDLDGNGLSNGYFQSTIFGGGSLTAAGQIAKINLLSKGWTIVGI